MNPFLRWPGGKRWLASDLAPALQTGCGTYYEPFLGSASIFFSFLPKKSVLTDTNSWLIETYQAIKDDHQKVLFFLQHHQNNHCKEYYYMIRQLKSNCYFENAARLIYLNRTCWNALFRVNKIGKYNVPIGTKTTVLLPTDKFDLWSRALKNAKVLSCDFSEAINMTGDGDLVYADPPYVTSHNKNGFIKYNENIFTWNDQKRLSDVCFSAASRGAKVIISNANHVAIRDLYNKSNVRFIEAKRQSVIAASNKNRIYVEEFVVFIDPK